MEPTQELFLFVYTKHNPTEKIQLLLQANHLCFCSAFTIHEICIFWPFLSDMIDCVSHLIGCEFGRLAEYSRPSPSVISGLLDSSKTSRLLLARICTTCWLGQSGLERSNLIHHFAQACVLQDKSWLWLVVYNLVVWGLWKSQKSLTLTDSCFLNPNPLLCCIYLWCGNPTRQLSED